MAKNAITVMQEGNKALDEINGKLQKTIENVLAINDAALKVGKNFFNVKSPQGLNESLKTNKTYVQQLNAELTQRKALEKALENQLAKNKLTESQLNAELVKSRFELQQRNKSVKEAAILSSKLSTEYQKLVVKMNQAGATVQNLNAKRLQGNKLTKQEATQLRTSEIAFKKYQAAVLGADASVGRFQRNVGNYSSAMRGAVGAARSLAGAMGLLGGAFLVVQVFRDAFRRIREFDKEMQNMAGILRTTRPELKELETRIIAVAASSIKTSNEVAQLATSLLVLGKSKSDVLALLEPVNNLSIALGATSEETGEFLIQTLNAFGKGSESAMDFADTIAAIRTSTSLDFQKMRDSFQYITPISQILGKDLAYTGAVVGVLADNGLKAESAGRLLATAQIKLATSGRSLQNALDELNNAYKEGKTGQELLAIANDSFGKQAAKIGVILATQQDRLQEYDNKIRQAGGSLDDLVNEQLKSVDAQLKITTSVWEEFILSIENGEGSISKALGSTLGFFNDVIRGWTLLNKTTDEYNEYLKNDLTNETFKEVSKTYKELGKDAEELAIKEADASRDKVEAIEKEIKALQDKNKELKGSFKEGFLRSTGFLTYGAVSTETEDNNKKIRELSASLGYYSGVLKASEAVIIGIDESQKDLNVTNETAEEINKKTIESLRKKIKLERDNIENIDLEVEGNKDIIKEKQDLIEKYQKEIDAILGVNKARKQGIEAIAGSLAFMEQEISKLEEKQPKLARTSNEYFEQEKAIRKAKEAVKEFKDEVSNLLLELDGVGKIDFIGSFEDSYQRIQEIIGDKDFGKIKGLEIDGANDEITEYFKKLKDNAREAAKILKEANEQITQNAQASFSESINFVNALFDAKVQRYEDDINKNNDYYAALLDNEQLSEEQRSALEAERDRKNLELEKKKREEQKKAAILNKVAGIAEVAINTAIAVSKVTAQTGVIAPLLIPSIIALGALQAATIAAQPIPQYKDGKKQGEGKDGIALLNDGGKDELKISASGEMERIKGRNVLGYVKKSDTIIPDADKFISSLTDEQLYNDIHRHSIMASLQGQSDTINNYLMAKTINSQTDRLVKAMAQNKANVKVYNNNSISEDLAFQLKLSRL